MAITPAQLAGAAHRVVHGGRDLTHTLHIVPAVLEGIRACIPLAPLHNPANLTGIEALARLAPNLAQYASFDTGFHATNPDVATRYALPKDAEDLGLRRYGFHGISYASLVRNLRAQGDLLPKRVLGLHLGNGASLCAILNGASVATSMGYSPVSGLTMGTRSGDIDANAVLKLAEVHGLEGAAQILNRASGLLGLGGVADMRALHEAKTPEARFAVDHFVYWAIRHAGSMIAAMGGVDLLAFTGGIGENDTLVRDGITQGLAWAGGPRAVVVPAEEEKQIAIDALALMAG
jgi:acetate kinase